VSEAARAAPETPTKAAAAVVGLFESPGAGAKSTTAFQTACVDLVTAKVDHLDEAWSDVHVKAVLTTACLNRMLFFAAAGNSSFERKDCLAFAGRLAGARHARIANGSAAGYADFCKEYSALALRTSKQPPAQEDTQEEETGAATGWLVQVIFAIIYYFTIVSKYPKVTEKQELPPDHPAVKLQEKNEVAAVGDVSPTNCFLSFCCPVARAAHTFHSTETIDYWAACLIMSCCPIWGTCGLLFFGNSCMPLNEKLGGSKRNPILNLLCVWLCQCCVIAQDAESLDLVAGVSTGVCSVTQN